MYPPWPFGTNSNMSFVIHTNTAKAWPCHFILWDSPPLWRQCWNAVKGPQVENDGFQIKEAPYSLFRKALVWPRWLSLLLVVCPLWAIKRLKGCHQARIKSVSITSEWMFFIGRAPQWYFGMVIFLLTPGLKYDNIMSICIYIMA